MIGGALERLPRGTRRSALRVLEAAGRRVPRTAVTAPLGGRVPVLRPTISRERLAQAVVGRHVLLTGASSGIGRETALALGRAGGTVTLVARREERLAEVTEQVRLHGGHADFVAGDLSDGDEADAIAETVLERHGRVDLLVNNAGHSIRRSLSRSYDRGHDFERTMALNYFGAVRLILTLLPGMRERGEGHVVNISTMGAEVGPATRFSAYLASKAALDAFTAAAAPETADDGVTWTTVFMPLVRTEMIAPTRAFARAPALTAREATQLVLEAIVDRPRLVSTPTGRTGALLYQLSPAAVEAMMSIANRLMPDDASLA